MNKGQAGIGLAVTLLLVTVAGVRADDFGGGFGGIIQQMHDLRDRYSNQNHPNYNRQNRNNTQPSAQDVKEARRQADQDQMVAAWKRSDYRSALTLLLDMQRLKNTAYVRKWIKIARGMIAYQDGDALWDKGDYDAAMASYRRGWALYPEHVTAARLQRQALLAKAYDYQQQRARENKAYYGSLAGTPSPENRRQGDALRDDASSLVQKGDYEAALDKANQALALVPDEASYQAVARMARAGIDIDNGRLENAIDELQAVVKLEPDNAAARRALKLAEEKRAAQARALQPALPGIWRSLQNPAVVEVAPAADPRVAAARNLPRQAEEIERSPGAAAARRGLAALIRADREGNPDDALSPAKRAEWEATADRDWQTAIAWYKTALQKDPQNAALKRMVGLCEYTLEWRRRTTAEMARHAPGPASQVAPAATTARRPGDESAAAVAMRRAAAARRLFARSPQPAGTPAPAKQSGDTLESLWWRETMQGISKEMGDEAADNAVYYLSIGDRQNAVKEARAAVELEPNNENFREALAALQAPDSQRKLVGQMPHAEFHFIHN